MLISMTAMCYVACFSCLLFSVHLFRSRPVNGLPCMLMAITFMVFAAQHFFLAMILNLEDAGFVAIARPSVAMTIGPLFLLFFSSAHDPDFKLEFAHILHFLPAVVICTEFLADTFVLNIDFAIITSFASYTVWIATKLNRYSRTRQHPDASDRAPFRWMAGFVVLLAIYTIFEFLIYLDAISWRSLSGSRSLLATLSLNIIVCLVVISAALQRPSQLDWLYNYGGSRSRAKLISDAECAELSTRFALLVDSESLFSRDGQSVSAIARRLGTTSRKLSESISRTYDESYLRFMNGRRVARAKELLTSRPHESMLNVMMESGFRSKSTFNEVFKNFQGQTPSEYRDSIDT